MAHSLNLFKRSRTAASDLSSSQFCAVSLNSSGQVALPSAGAQIYGVVQNKPTSGETAEIMVLGVTKMIVGSATVAAGAAIMVDTSGKAVTATTGNAVIGYAEDGGASGTTISVLLLPAGKI